jgi:hypothetical protein
MRTVLLVTIVIAYTAHAQISSGTLVVIDRTKDTVVIAADSMAEFDEKTGIPPQYDYCKISAFRHKIVFAAAGTAEYFGTRFPFPTRLLWSDKVVARESIRAVGDVSVESISGEWERRMWLNWLLQYRQNPDIVKRAAAVADKGILALGFFMSANNGVADESLSVIAFNKMWPIPLFVHHSTLACQDCGFPGHQFCAVGQTEVALEMCLAQTPRSHKWRASLVTRHISPSALAADLVAISETYSKPSHIGGPVDSLELDKRDGSIRWLARKDNCPENQD